MLRDLSETLSALLAQPGGPAELLEAQIAFDRPTEQYNPTQTTVNLFLYDIRENVELRDNEVEIEWYNGQATLRQPPLRVAVSYLVTAWPASGTDLCLQEHRLLSQVLQVLARYPTIPAAFLVGSLQNQEPPIPLSVATANGVQSSSEFWTALGSPLRASLTVKATVSLPTREPATVAIARTHELRLAGETSRYLIGGRVTDEAGNPITGATVALVEHGASAQTDSEGRYRLGSIPADSYTLRVEPPQQSAQQFPLTIPAIAGGDYDIQLVAAEPS